MINIWSTSTECPEEHMFPCVVTPPNEPYCVSELQFCDGVVDCPDGSDEPVDCVQGNSTTSNSSLVYAHKNIIITSILYMHI